MPASFRPPRSSAFAACTLFFALGASATTSAQPTGPHPRTFLRPDVLAAWQADTATGPVRRAIDLCADAAANPSAYASGQYQGFAWVETLGPCLVAWKATGDAAHRDTALVYFRALLDDRDTVGDGLGPSYPGGYGIVAQDTGYSMRTFGVYAALGYDWLHDELTQAERDRAHARFTTWLGFHFAPDTYMRAQPGANYHAGHVLAVTLIAIAHGDEMNALSPGSGAALYDYVVGEMWGQTMAGGYAARGPLLGGDWLEGWQYGPLSVANYALAARALAEQGVSFPFVSPYLGDVVLRYVHGLTPADRMIVGGDTGDDTPSLAINDLPLLAALLGPSSPEVKGWARAERARLAQPLPRDFKLFFECLALGERPTTPGLDRSALPTGYLAEGSGNFYQRTAFGPSGTQALHACRGLIVDHQHEDAGNVLLTRGPDELLVDPSPYGSLSTLTSNAPTLSQADFIPEYRPGQGPFGESYDVLVPYAESTHVRFATSTASNVHASRCAYEGQFRFRDVPSTSVDGATRDVVTLPGADGASVVIVDRVRTGATYASEPLLLRFHATQGFTGSGADVSTSVGASRLRIRRVIGDASNTTVHLPIGSCSGPRGDCEVGRFDAYAFHADVAGPNPFAVHLLDADAAAAPGVLASTVSLGAQHQLSLVRGTRRFVVTVTGDASAVGAIDDGDVPTTHVVLDPPVGARVAITASPTATGCHYTLTATTGNDGFASPPLVFGTDAGCAVVPDDAVPPVSVPNVDAGFADVGPRTDGGFRWDGGTSGDGGVHLRGRGGCSAATSGPSHAKGVFALVLVALAARRRIRRRREGGGTRGGDLGYPRRVEEMR